MALDDAAPQNPRDSIDHGIVSPEGARLHLQVAAAGKLQDAARALFAAIGEDPQRDGLQGTPDRYMSAMLELLQGYDMDPQETLKTRFESDTDQMILVRDMPFYSLCEHHILPFYGLATLGYIPSESGTIIGLSKVPRLVNCLAQRLQVQERLTTDIATHFNEALSPLGVGVVIRATHMCMAMRGVKSEAEMQTSCLLGVMRDDPSARAEFMALAW